MRKNERSIEDFLGNSGVQRETDNVYVEKTKEIAEEKKTDTAEAERKKDRIKKNLARLKRREALGKTKRGKNSDIEFKNGEFQITQSEGKKEQSVIPIETIKEIKTEAETRTRPEGPSAIEKPEKKTTGGLERKKERMEELEKREKELLDIFEQNKNKAWAEKKDIITVAINELEKVRAEKADAEKEIADSEASVPAEDLESDYEIVKKRTPTDEEREKLNPLLTKTTNTADVYIPEKSIEEEKSDSLLETEAKPQTRLEEDDTQKEVRVESPGTGELKKKKPVVRGSEMPLGEDEIDATDEMMANERARIAALQSAKESNQPPQEEKPETISTKSNKEGDSQKSTTVQQRFTDEYVGEIENRREVEKTGELSKFSEDFKQEKIEEFGNYTKEREAKEQEDLVKRNEWQAEKIDELATENAELKKGLENAKKVERKIYAMEVVIKEEKDKLIAEGEARKTTVEKLKNFVQKHPKVTAAIALGLIGGTYSTLGGVPLYFAAKAVLAKAGISIWAPYMGGISSPGYLAATGGIFGKELKGLAEKIGLIKKEKDVKSAVRDVLANISGNAEIKTNEPQITEEKTEKPEGKKESFFSKIFGKRGNKEDEHKNIVEQKRVYEDLHPELYDTLKLFLEEKGEGRWKTALQALLANRNISKDFPALPLIFEVRGFNVTSNKKDFAEISIVVNEETRIVHIDFDDKKRGIKITVK